MGYDVEEVKAPRLAGWKLRAFTALALRPVLGSPIRRFMLEQVGVQRLRALDATGCSPARPSFRERAAGASVAAAADPLSLAATAAGIEPRGEIPGASVADFARAYREGRTTPVEVAERFLAAHSAEESATPPLRAFIAWDRDDLLRQAEASLARHREGRPLSVLDGVPIAIKDEVDMTPFPTTVGTRFLGREPATSDATTVARLRAAGALLVGKANMHELGLGVTGLNPHHGAARNPHDPTRATGGSSSGPAAAVASGLVPAALGADGGGSIRIPAGLTGIVGLKPTYGRVSEHGAAPLCWSVAHIGPMAGTARDAAALYAVLAGPDPSDPGTLLQPPVDLAGFPRDDLRGVRLGVYRPWLRHADRGVVAACESALEGLSRLGAEVVEVKVPGLEDVRLAHVVLIASEMAAARYGSPPDHAKAMGHDVRLNFALARELTAADYVQALRLRDRLVRTFEDVLDTVDGLVTPATGTTAPLLRPDAFETGESDLPLLDRIMRFAPAPNLTGHPAVSFPAGYDEAGLPVGLQVIGRAWQEPFLLALAHAAEGFVARRRPARFRDLLAG